jgi:hypothetical protein
LGEAGVSPLSEERLASIREEATARLATNLGLDAIQVAALRATRIEIADLPGLMLGTEENGRIVIDSDAAGRGWFADATPGDDSEFRRAGPDGQWATPNSAAFGQFDLLSAVMHELGHVAGLDHADDGGFMQATLSAGQRTAPAGTVSVFEESQNDFVGIEDARFAGQIAGLFGTTVNQTSSDEFWIVRGLEPSTEEKREEKKEQILLPVKAPDARLAGQIAALLGTTVNQTSSNEFWIVRGLEPSTEEKPEEKKAQMLLQVKAPALSTATTSAQDGPAAGKEEIATKLRVDWKAKFTGLVSSLRSGL